MSQFFFCSAPELSLVFKCPYSRRNLQIRGTILALSRNSVLELSLPLSHVIHRKLFEKELFETKNINSEIAEHGSANGSQAKWSTGANRITISLTELT